MKKISVLLASSVILLILGNAGSLAQPPKTKIKLGYLPVNDLQAFVAEEKGFYAQQGLEVETIRFAGGPESVRALLAGSIEGGLVGVQPMFHVAAQSLPIFIVVADALFSQEYPGDALMVHPDSSIRSVADLKGKLVALNQKGTIIDVFLDAVLYFNKIKVEEISKTFVPFSQMGPVLAHKQVDAAWSWPPFIAFMKANNEGKILIQGVDFLPYYSIAGIAMRKDFVEKNREVVSRFIKAMVMANRWINRNREEAKLIIGRGIKIPDDIARRQRLPYFTENGTHPMPSVWNTYYMMVKVGQIPPIKDVHDKVKEYFVRPMLEYTIPAVRDIGMARDEYVQSLLKRPLPFLDQEPKYYWESWEK